MGRRGKQEKATVLPLADYGLCDGQQFDGHYSDFTPCFFPTRIPNAATTYYFSSDLFRTRLDKSWGISEVLCRVNREQSALRVMLFGSRTTDAMGASFLSTETRCIDYDLMLIGQGTSQDAAKLVYLLTSLLFQDLNKTAGFQQVLSGNIMEIRVYGQSHHELATRKIQINLVPCHDIQKATDNIDFGPTAIFFDGTTVFATPFTMQQFTARTISLTDAHCPANLCGLSRVIASGDWRLSIRDWRLAIIAIVQFLT